MAISARDRQAAYVRRLRAGVAPVVKVIKAPIPTTRTARLAGLVAGLTGFRDEYQTWIDRLPDDYAERSDDNAERLADVESLIENVTAALDSLADIEAPRIRLD